MVTLPAIICHEHGLRNMKEILIKFVQNWLASSHESQFALSGVLQQQYGFSVILENKVTKNRFVPTILPAALIQKALVQNDVKARAALNQELETGLSKELISG